VSTKRVIPVGSEGNYVVQTHTRWGDCKVVRDEHGNVVEIQSPGKQTVSGQKRTGEKTITAIVEQFGIDGSINIEVVEVPDNTNLLEQPSKRQNG
jgi:hypothetical protein